MSSMKDFLRRRREKQHRPPPPAPAARPRAVEVEPREALAYRCGHRVGVRLLQSQPCPACAKVQRQERQKRRCQRQREKREARPDPGRLPHGARFVLNYDAEKVQWTGQLQVGARVFLLAGSGLWKLLGALDREYRQTLEAEAG